MKERALLVLRETKEVCEMKGIEVVYTRNYVNQILHGSEHVATIIYKELCDILDSVYLDKSVKKISL